MNILGICNDETASACLMLDGTIVAAVSEERFSRLKMDSSFPVQSIHYCLDTQGFSLNDIDIIAYAWSKGFQQDLLPLYVDKAALFSNDKQSLSILGARVQLEIDRDKKKRDEFDQWVDSNVDLSRTIIKDFYHHEAHAASAAYYSPFDNGLVYTSDGRGDFEACTIWRFDRQSSKQLTKLYSALSLDSFGFYYGRITGLLGFQPMRHEGKITGLAAYGDRNAAIDLCKQMIRVSDGRVESHIGDYYAPFFQPYSDLLIKAIAQYTKEDVAASAQYYLECMMTDLLEFYLQKQPENRLNIMAAGGVFGNVKVTHKLKQLDKVASVYVQPQMGDGGLCLGACALANEQALSSKAHAKRHTSELTSMYLGPYASDTYSNNSQTRFATISQKQFDRNTGPKELAQSLNKDRVIGLIQGRMEFGPRALCNRSIIYRTSDVTINDWLNKRLNRNEFMPFAPVLKEEKAMDIISGYDPNDITLHFMTSTVDCTETFAQEHPAVVHIDGTARPQIITKTSNPFMWDVLGEWEKVSGEIALVNTSFNTHEEPIIRDLYDGLNALDNKVIDELWFVTNESVTLYTH